MAFPGVFKRYFPPRKPCYFIRILTNNAVKIDIARFERFTDLNLFRYAFNDIQNWETDALQYYSMVLIFS